MAKSRKDNKGRVLEKAKHNVAVMESMFIHTLIRRGNVGAFILRTSWSCGRGKKS